MENICSVRQQPFEICRMRHELIEIEEYTPWRLDFDCVGRGCTRMFIASWNLRSGRVVKLGA
jgi:hypothetical protein